MESSPEPEPEKAVSLPELVILKREQFTAEDYMAEDNLPKDNLEAPFSEDSTCTMKPYTKWLQENENMSSTLIMQYQKKSESFIL